MLVNLNEVFKYANKHEVAIGAFNTPTLEMLRGVINAAEKLDIPVIIQHAEGHNNLIPLNEIGPIMIQYAKRSKVPVCVHLDHGSSLEICIEAIKLGFTSVMYDASTKGDDINIKETKKVVEFAKDYNVTVEAELGHMLNSTIGAGEARVKASRDYNYTDVDQADQFIRVTKVDCLAIAVGTMHGVYLEKPELNLERINEIHDYTNTPLVLHGGSGLTKDDYQTAIKNGIRKINYYTYMNIASGEAVRKEVNKNSEYNFYDEYSKIALDSVYKNVLNIMKIFTHKI